jgi:hypothetical protein
VTITDIDKYIHKWGFLFIVDGNAKWYRALGRELGNFLYS